MCAVRATISSFLPLTATYPSEGSWPLSASPAHQLPVCGPDLDYPVSSLLLNERAPYSGRHNARGPLGYARSAGRPQPEEVRPSPAWTRIFRGASEQHLVSVCSCSLYSPVVSFNRSALYGRSKWRVYTHTSLNVACQPSPFCEPGHIIGPEAHSTVREWDPSTNNCCKWAAANPQCSHQWCDRGTRYGQVTSNGGSGI